MSIFHKLQNSGPFQWGHVKNVLICFCFIFVFCLFLFVFCLFLFLFFFSYSKVTRMSLVKGILVDFEIEGSRSCHVLVMSKMSWCFLLFCFFNLEHHDQIQFRFLNSHSCKSTKYTFQCKFMCSGWKYRNGLNKSCQH